LKRQRPGGGLPITPCQWRPVLAVPTEQPVRRDLTDLRALAHARPSSQSPAADHATIPAPRIADLLGPWQRPRTVPDAVQHLHAVAVVDFSRKALPVPVLLHLHLQPRHTPDQLFEHTTLAAAAAIRGQEPVE